MAGRISDFDPATGANKLRRVPARLTDRFGGLATARYRNAAIVLRRSASEGHLMTPGSEIPHRGAEGLAVTPASSHDPDDLYRNVQVL